MSLTETTTINTGPEQASSDDLGSLYRHLRVVDVADALDGIGYFDIGLLDKELRPLWSGMKFWGPAATIRAVPSNRPMWKLENTQDIVEAHRIWFEKNPPAGLPKDLNPGHVIVMDAGGGPEVGYWGSENAMGAVLDGAVGIVTDGYCRDTAEVANQRTYADVDLLDNQTSCRDVSAVGIAQVVLLVVGAARTSSGGDFGDCSGRRGSAHLAAETGELQQGEGTAERGGHRGHDAVPVITLGGQDEICSSERGRLQLASAVAGRSESGRDAC